MANPERPARKRLVDMKILPKLSRERIRTANGRQVHVNGGGARAWAREPVRELTRSGLRSSQTMRSGCRYGAATASCGGSTGAPVWATLQREQHPSCRRGIPGRIFV